MIVIVIIVIIFDMVCIISDMLVITFIIHMAIMILRIRARRRLYMIVIVIIVIIFDMVCIISGLLVITFIIHMAIMILSNIILINLASSDSCSRSWRIWARQILYMLTIIPVIFVDIIPFTLILQRPNGFCSGALSASSFYYWH